MAQTLADVFVEDRRQWNSEQDKSDRIYVEKVDDIMDVPLASPKVKFNILAGAVFGAIAGGIIVFFLEWLQADVISTAADVEKSVGAAVLGAIPAGDESKPGAKSGNGRLAWIDPGLLLAFLELRCSPGSVSVGLAGPSLCIASRRRQRAPELPRAESESTSRSVRP